MEFLRRLVKINQILGRKSKVRQKLDMNLEIEITKNAFNKKYSLQILFFIEKKKRNQHRNLAFEKLLHCIHINIADFGQKP